MALGLMPLLAAFPVVIAVLAFAGGHWANTLLESNLRSNLAGARNYLDGLKTQSSKRIEQMVRSHSLQQAVRQAIIDAPDTVLDKVLQDAVEGSGLDYLVVVTAQGEIVGSSTGAQPGSHLPETYVLRQARIGVTSAAYEQFTPAQLSVLSPRLTEQLRLPPTETGSRQLVTDNQHALLINAAAHFPLAVDMPDAILLGGVLFNRNHALIDHMREIIYPLGTLPDEAEGMAAVYLDGIRIAVSSQRLAGLRRVGQPAPPAVIESVMERGQPWHGKIIEDGSSYLAGFEALQDGDGQRVGMISAGFPSEPYERVWRWLLGAVALLLALTMLAISVLFLRSGRMLTSRLKRMGDTMQAVHSGDRLARVDLSGPMDEITELGRDFNQLLDTIVAQDERQRQTQLVIANEAARRRALFEHARDGVMICDAAGRVLESNPSAAAMLGWEADELVGHRLHEWDASHSAAEVQHMLGQVDDSGLFYMTRHRRRDGGVYWAEMSLSRAEWAGQTFVLALQRDISGRKAAEAEVESQRQELEQRSTELAAANEAKSAFLANMSHEIRTPMGAVIGLSNLLLDTELSPEQRDFLEKIHLASTSLLGVLNDILDHTKIDARSLRIESIPLRITDILRKSEALFAFQAQEKGLVLSFDCDPAVPPMLLGDPLRMLQVVNNLIGNALKFTEQGSIRVQVECLERGADTVRLKVTVRDTGVGIRQDDIERLFDAFQQADASTTRQYGGTGLGLSITKGLVELMGGEVGASSEIGQGSSFWFTVRFGLPAPAASTPPKAAEAPKADGQHKLSPLDIIVAPIRGARVLVVDDNMTNLLVASAYLRKMGLQAETANSGQSAIEKSQQGHFDAILMDLQMPELDGFETSRAIRATELGRTTPIIALTAAASLADRDATAAAGMNDHVAKPIDTIELATTLVKWIASDDGRRPGT